MSFFWFLVAIVLLIVLLSRQKPASNDYDRGFWDGYRALGSRVQEQLEQPTVDSDALQAAVAVGYGGVTPLAASPANVAQEELLYEDPIVVPAAPVLSPQARSLRNLNTILYMASFLLVAAGALFVSAAMPNVIKLVGVWLIIVLFYGVGYVLHQKVARLRPASIAFLGTGLALIPFAGFALQAYTAMGPNAAWLTTSVVGVIAYFVAAIRLQNQVVSYLAVAFVLSLVASTSASVSMALVWQFVVMIGVALAASSLALVKPSWVPPIFREPIERTGQLVTPVVLVASLFVGSHLKIYGYELIFLVAAVYYAVVWLQTRQLIYETALRVIVPVTGLIYLYDWSNGNATAMGLGLLAVAVIQLAYSLLRVMAPAHASVERVWLIVALCLHAASFSLWQQADQAHVLNVIALLLLGCASLAAMLRLRSVGFGGVGVIVSYILPFVVIRQWLEPALEWWVLAAWFVFAAAATIAVTAMLRHRSLALRELLTTAYLGYAGLAVVTALWQNTSGFSTSILVLVTLMIAAASYVTRQPKVLILAVIALPLAVFYGWNWLALPHLWMTLGVAWTAATFCYLGYGVAYNSHDTERQMIFLWATWVLLGLGVFINVFDPITSTAAALTLVLLAATIAVHGYTTKRRDLIEAGIYMATLGLQRWVGIAAPDVNVVLYGHWWALTIAAVTWLYAERTQTRLIIGLAFMSASSAVYAFSEGGSYQLLFLAEHIALLLYGALRLKSWALWWGLTGASLAVVYLLGGFTFWSLGFLGLLLIGIVVWRLLRSSKTVST